MMKKKPADKTPVMDIPDETVLDNDSVDSSDHSSFSQSDLLQENLQEAGNEFPVSKDTEEYNKLTQSLASLPKDHELLKEILGEDYATQTISSNDIYQKEGSTKLNTGADEANIDDLIRTILNEDDELFGHSDIESTYLDSADIEPTDIESTDIESTDIDAFLQKYMMDDDPSEISHDDKDVNVDELIQTILNEDSTNENLQLSEYRTEADTLIGMTESKADYKIPVVKSRQNIPAQNNISHVPESRSAEIQNVISKTGNSINSKSSTVNYRIPGIALLSLIIVVGLVWYFVAEPEQEPAHYSEIKSSNVTEIKKDSVPLKEISTVLDQKVPQPEVSDLSINYSESSTEFEKAIPIVNNPVSIDSTITHLIEQETSVDDTKLTDDRSSEEAEDKAHNIALETIISTSDEEPRTEVSDETNIPAESQPELEEVTSELTLSAVEEPRSEVSDEINIPTESQPEFEEVTSEVTLSAVEEPRTEVSDEINIPTESQPELEEVTSEVILSAKVQQNPLTEENADGEWALNLSSVHNQIKAATKVLENIREAGIPAEIIPVFVNKKKWYRIRVIGFSSYAEAKDFMAEVTEKTDIDDYWINKVAADSE